MDGIKNKENEMMQHVKACSNCTEEMARRVAKKLADELQTIMASTLTELKIDDNGMFQGQVYHLLSAFILSISIKILEMNKLPKFFISEMCSSNIDMAIEFAKHGRFFKAEEH